MIIDSHCHLDFPELNNDLNGVVKRAKDNNVEFLLTICTSVESYKKIKPIIKKYENIYGTFGIHPHESKNHINVNKEYIVREKTNCKKIIGIGETGLDFYYNNSDRSIQKKSFIEHIEAALQLDIPLIVHTRNAEMDTYDILKSEKKNSNLKVLIHCFTGSKDFSKRLIDMNCYISVSGIITFKNSNELSKTVSEIPLENILVETDSPYLAPVPFRGKPNEPSFIVHTIKRLSELKKISDSEIIKHTSSNFKKLFNIK